jgi:dTDP-glucose pyrophosphorylase
VDCTVACFESVDHSTVVEVEAEVEADYSTVVEVEVEVEAEVEVEVEVEVEADYSIVATYADSIAELVEKADNSEYCYTVAGCYYYDHECMVD